MIFSLPKVNRDGVLAIHSTPQNRLGEYFCDNERNQLWVYVRANEAITKGLALSSISPTAITTGLEAAAAGSRELTFSTAVNLDTTFPRVPNQPQFTEYMIVAQTGGSQFGTVHSHAERQCAVEWYTEDDLQLGTALAANANVDFGTPWLMRTAVTAGSVVGFAQRAIAIGEYFWALVDGVGFGYSTAAVVQNTPLRITTTAGELDDGGGNSDPCAYSTANQSAADELISIIASAPVKIGIPPFQGVGNDIAYQYPTP